MVQGDIHVKFLGDAQRGEDIVRPVGVGLQRNFLVNHRQHSLQLHIHRGLFGVFRVGGIGFFGLVVFHCPGQQVPQQRRRAHAGNRHFFLAAVNPLGVFAKGAFHSHRIFEDHVVYPLAVHLDCHKGSAHHVAAAGAGHRSGDAGGRRLGQGFVHRLDGVNGPDMRRHGVGAFIAVCAFKADGGFLQADVAMAVHQAGGH